MNKKNMLWRAVAVHPDNGSAYDESFVYVDAPDREAAKRLICERLSFEWEVAAESIEFYNLMDEKELHEMASNTELAAGASLLECGWCNGKAIYDADPLILVASPALRYVLEAAYKTLVRRDFIKEVTCIGCGCTDSRNCLDAFHNPCHWIKVNRETGLGVCSHCKSFLNHPCAREHD
ncbi:TPA: hypothetical protein KIA93_000340 [Salmonella enterica]|uniref:hypothetical protein n=1 Tax=Salmonella enterica TaxID=28901 RepID=UPI001590FBFD|nr:hypothetical protein [Salmonella enterica]HBD1844134.1 hypothetical protein [Salmonella enterica]